MIIGEWICVGELAYKEYVEFKDKVESSKSCVNTSNVCGGFVVLIYSDDWIVFYYN